MEQALLGNDNKYIKITPGSSSLLYYMPLIMVNPFYSDYLASSFQDGLSWVFADMINYFIRPVNEVVDAIERFKVRYMDGNTVVGMQMSVMPGHGTWLGDGMMPVKQQDLFFSTASTLLTPSSTSGVYVVDIIIYMLQHLRAKGTCVFIYAYLSLVSFSFYFVYVYYILYLH